jgi:hypothetical protein
MSVWSGPSVHGSVYGPGKQEPKPTKFVDIIKPQVPQLNIKNLMKI